MGRRVIRGITKTLVEPEVTYIRETKESNVGFSYFCTRCKKYDLGMHDDECIACSLTFDSEKKTYKRATLFDPKDSETIIKEVRDRQEPTRNIISATVRFCRVCEAHDNSSVSLPCSSCRVTLEGNEAVVAPTNFVAKRR